MNKSRSKHRDTNILQLYYYFRRSSVSSAVNIFRLRSGLGWALPSPVWTCYHFAFFAFLIVFLLSFLRQIPKLLIPFKHFLSTKIHATPYSRDICFVLRMGVLLAFLVVLRIQQSLKHVTELASQSQKYEHLLPSKCGLGQKLQFGSCPQQAFRQAVPEFWVRRDGGRSWAGRESPW